MGTPWLERIESGRPRSRRGHAAQLPLEGRDVTPAKPPLPALLDAREEILARVLVHGIRTQVQNARNILAVEQCLVSLHFRNPYEPQCRERVPNNTACWTSQSTLCACAPPGLTISKSAD